MANQYINLYMNNPTANDVDVTQVSTDDTNTAPLSFVLDASKAESGIQKVALRCAVGYCTIGDTVISAVDKDTSDDTDNTSKWSFAADDDYADAVAAAKATFTPTLTIKDQIEAVNKVFWVKAASTKGEVPQNDTTVALNIKTVIGAVTASADTYSA